jgi:hypothetical protein
VIDTGGFTGKPELEEELEELEDELEEELGLPLELDELEEEAVVIFSDGTKQPVSDAERTASARGLMIKWLTDIGPPSSCYYRYRIQPNTIFKGFCNKQRLTSELGLKAIF